jgi:cyanophycin synthetase
MGYKVGFTTSDGIYIQNRILDTGDCTGPKSTEFVLRDPTVDFAVLECARGGILRAGLGFSQCDIGIVTNIAPDHLGLSDIDSLEQLAQVKSVVLETVAPTGHAIMNADNDLTYKMREILQCNKAYFSMDENNPRIKSHLASGGIAAVAENGYITICKGNWKLRVEKIVNIPLTFSGKALFNVENILAATLAGFLRGFKLEDLRVALTTFVPSPAQTPGRMNIFKFKNFDVMIDYAHNAHGLEAVGHFIKQVDAPRKIGVIAGVGDRRDEDTHELGRVAADIFDEIIIRQDKNLRGRTEEEIINLLIEGIKSVDSTKKYMVIPREREAIEYVVKNSPKNSFITICSDVVPDALEQVMRLKEAEEDLIL